MSTPRVALDLAEWLDSPRAGRLAGLDRAAERAALERFLSVAYDELGKAPRLLDDQELELLLRERLPARFGRKDPAIPHVAALLEAYLDHLEEVHHVPHAYELRAALARNGPAFARAVAARGDAAPDAPPAQPVVNRAPKLGRNDPCWCGSGRKFKKCHGAGTGD